MATKRPPQPAVSWREWWRRTAENAYVRVAMQVGKAMLVGAGMIVKRCSSKPTMAYQAGAAAAPSDWPPARPPAPPCLTVQCAVGVVLIMLISWPPTVWDALSLDNVLANPTLIYVGAPTASLPSSARPAPPPLWLLHLLACQCRLPCLVRLPL